MRIIAASGEFELPTDFAAELTRNNVLLTEAGEQTAPITLPGSPHNLRLVGYSDRIDAFYKPITDLDVTVMDGLMNRPCNLGIHSADPIDGISATIYLATGDFYSRAGDKKLASLPWPINTSTVANLITQLKSEYVTPTDECVFRIVPVITTQEYTFVRNAVTSLSSETVVVTAGVPLLDESGNQQYNLDGEGNRVYLWETAPVTKIVYSSVRTDIDSTEKLILNSFDQDYEEPLPVGYTQTYHLSRFSGESVQKIKIDKDIITLPVGYGMTPFLKLRFIIEFIFQQFGYTVNTQAISNAHAEYNNKMLVVNNVADAICSGTIRYNQLVPDVTVSEFILKIESLFSGKFIVNEVNDTATFYSFKNQLNSIPDLDLSQYITSKPKIGTSEFSILQLIDNSIEVKTSETDESKLKINSMTFDFVKISVLYPTKLFVKLDLGKFYYLSYTLETSSITDIIHKNTSIVIADKTIKEDVKSNSNISIINTRYEEYCWGGDQANGEIIYIAYRTASNMFYSNNSAIINTIRTAYTEYAAFLLNSNIPINSEMDIPTSVLEQLKLYIPKLLLGQPVMIESIKDTLGKKGTQAVTFRTLRPYSDR